MLAALIATVLFASQLTPDQQKEVVEMHDALATCSIYYMMSAQAFRNSSKEDEALIADEASEQMLGAALLLDDRETTRARMEMHKDDMMKRIEGDYSNFSRLIHTYNQGCSNLVNIVRTNSQ